MRCGAITHSTKERRQQKEQEAGGWEGGWRKFEKGGVGNVGRPSGNRGV